MFVPDKTVSLCCGLVTSPIDINRNFQPVIQKPLGDFKIFWWHEKDGKGRRSETVEFTRLVVVACTL